MASVWNVMRAANYNSVAENNENSAACSPIPDKFRQKLTVSSLRMSLRKRIPLKRINVNGTSTEHYGAADTKKQKVENNKNKSKAVETTVKKTIFRVAEQFTGNAKKSQLKETPQKSTPRTRYRERLRSPPDTPSPSTPVNPFDSPCCSTPISQVEKLKRYTRTPINRKNTRRTPRKTTQKGVEEVSDNFSRHLELVSCGIQQLESNSNKMAAAIERIGLDYESSPIQTKMKSQNRLWRDEKNMYSTMSSCSGNLANKNQINTTNSHSSNSKGMLRRTMTRMSLRVKNRPNTALRSTKSASSLGSHCYNGPMASGLRKLAPLQEYKMTK